MSRERLIQMAKHNIEHSRKGTIDMEPDVFKVPAGKYFEQDQFEREVKQVFRRMPLMLAATAELRNPGDYKSMDVIGMPVIIWRDGQGEVHAYANSCSHRGAPLVDPGHGNAKRLICPYHAWSFDQQGDLVAIASKEEFGEIDTACYGLVKLPTAERAGLIWVILDRHSPLDIDNFLSGYDDMLSHFGFETWHLFEQRTLKGPNWKIAYDGYLDLYHLPVLHRETFGPEMSNQALYYSWGPHQRVTSPSRHMVALEGLPEEEWSEDILMAGVWTIFPHISIASFNGGGRSVMISQLFPGETPQESYTTQYYLMEKKPNEVEAKEAAAQFKLLEYVVQDEDYKTGLRQQQALVTGVRDHVLFGRNEGGGHRFHRWVDRIIDANDQELNSLFAEAAE